MIRFDAGVSSADDPLREPAGQRPVAAVTDARALEDAMNSRPDGGPADRNGAAFAARADAKGPAGVHVDLSRAGKAMAFGGARAGRADRNADIDKADLPDPVKKLLKRIRQIREDLRKKQAELREAMADTKMRPQRRKMKVAMLQAEVMALTSALMLASNALGKLINELKLSQEQARVAGQLIMA